MKKIFLILALLLLSGCAKTMGIYDNDFSCPRNEVGECLSVEEAHRKALRSGADGQGKDTVVSDFKLDPREEEQFSQEDMQNFQGTLRTYERCLKSKSPETCEEERKKLLGYYRTAEDRGQAKVIHGVDMQERVTRLAAMQAVVEGGSNTTPVRQPDTVMELHVMPYKTSFGALASERVMWVVVQEGQWTWATTAGRSGSRPKLGETR